jgi:hypothetical protein
VNVAATHPEILIWHAERINFAEFFTLQKLKTWLIDTKGPRLEDIPARLTSLRNMLFQRATMEVQDPKSYESYGLEILDEISFQNWKLVHPKPDMVEERVIAPQNRDPDLAMAVGVRPGKRPKTKIATKDIQHASAVEMFQNTWRWELDYDPAPGCKKKDGVLTEEWPVYRNAKYPVHVGGNRHNLPLVINNPKGITGHHPDVLDTLLKWSKTGALKVIKKGEDEPLMTSALILVPKGLGWRVCNDGSPLTFLERKSVTCKLDGVKEVMMTIQKGDLLLKLNDKSAFHHLLLDPMSSRIAAMKWGDVTFAYRAAAFGIPRIPSEYQLINGAPINFLRNRGHIILLYLDDRLLVIRPKS